MAGDTTAMGRAMFQENRLHLRLEEFVIRRLRESEGLKQNRGSRQRCRPCQYHKIPESSLCLTKHSREVRYQYEHRRLPGSTVSQRTQWNSCTGVVSFSLRMCTAPPTETAASLLSRRRPPTSMQRQIWERDTILDWSVRCISNRVAGADIPKPKPIALIKIIYSSRLCERRCLGSTMEGSKYHDKIQTRIHLA